MSQTSLLSSAVQFGFARKGLSGRFRLGYRVWICDTSRFRNAKSWLQVAIGTCTCVWGTAANHKQVA